MSYIFFAIAAFIAYVAYKYYKDLPIDGEEQSNPTYNYASKYRDKKEVPPERNPVNHEYDGYTGESGINKLLKKAKDEYDDDALAAALNIALEQVKREPANAKTYIICGDVYLAMGENIGSADEYESYKNAIKMYQSAIVIDPDNAESLYKFANACYKAESNSFLAEETPSEKQLLAILARGDRALKKATQLEPSNAKSFKLWGMILSSIAFLERNFSKKQDTSYAEAFSKFKTATELAPNDPSIYEEWADSLSEKAIQTNDKKLINEAQELYRQASVRSTDKAELISWASSLDSFGDVTGDTRFYEDACEKYREAINDSPDNTYTSYLAEILFKRAELDNDNDQLLLESEKYCKKFMNRKYAYKDENMEALLGKIQIKKAVATHNIALCETAIETLEGLKYMTNRNTFHPLGIAYKLLSSEKNESENLIKSYEAFRKAVDYGRNAQDEIFEECINCYNQLLELEKSPNASAELKGFVKQLIAEDDIRTIYLFWASNYFMKLATPKDNDSDVYLHYNNLFEEALKHSPNKDLIYYEWAMDTASIADRVNDIKIYQDAIDRIKIALDLDPTNDELNIMWAHSLIKIAEANNTLHLEKEKILALLEKGNNPEALFMKENNPFYIFIKAQLYAALNDMDTAFFWFENGLKMVQKSPKGSMITREEILDEDLTELAFLSGLRKDPRFKELIEEYIPEEEYEEYDIDDEVEKTDFDLYFDDDVYDDDIEEEMETMTEERIAEVVKEKEAQIDLTLYTQIEEVQKLTTTEKYNFFEQAVKDHPEEELYHAFYVSALEEYAKEERNPYKHTVALKELYEQIHAELKKTDKNEFIKEYWAEATLILARQFEDRELYKTVIELMHNTSNEDSIPLVYSELAKVSRDSNYQKEALNILEQTANNLSAEDILNDTKRIFAYGAYDQAIAVMVCGAEKKNAEYLEKSIAMFKSCIESYNDQRAYTYLSVALLHLGIMNKDVDMMNECFSYCKQYVALDPQNEEAYESWKNMLNHYKFNVYSNVNYELEKELNDTLNLNNIRL